MRHQTRDPLCAATARGRREATPFAVASPALVAHGGRVLRPDLGAATWCSAAVVCLRSRAAVSRAAVQQNSSRYHTRCVSDTAPWGRRSTTMVAVALVVESRPRTLTSTPIDDSSTSMVPRSLPKVGGAGADARAPSGDGWHERSPHPESADTVRLPEISDTKTTQSKPPLEPRKPTQLALGGPSLRPHASTSY